MDKPIPQEIRQNLKSWRRGKDTEATESLRYESAPKQCEHCDRWVVNRTERLNVVKAQTLHPHVKTQCLECKMFKNPVTGAYDCTLYEVNSHFRPKKQSNR